MCESALLVASHFYEGNRKNSRSNDHSQHPDHEGVHPKVVARGLARALERRDVQGIARWRRHSLRGGLDRLAS